MIKMQLAICSFNIRFYQLRYNRDTFDTERLSSALQQLLLCAQKEQLAACVEISGCAEDAYATAKDLRAGTFPKRWIQKLSHAAL